MRVGSLESVGLGLELVLGLVVVMVRVRVMRLTLWHRGGMLIIWPKSANHKNAPAGVVLPHHVVASFLEGRMEGKTWRGEKRKANGEWE